MLVDTHCHLDFPEFNPDRDNVIEQAAARGVGIIVNIGSSLEGSRASVALAKQYANIYATVGIHPHEADHYRQTDKDELRVLAKEEKVVAIGEIGLDYFKNYSKPEHQRNLFISLLGLAQETNLPVVLHSRQADEDLITIIKTHLPLKAVVHCFSGDEKFMYTCLELGFFISFTCNITYKKASMLREVVKKIPLERLMLETDAPYLPPEGLRGRRNEPGNVFLLAEEIAKIKGLSKEEITQVTTNNARIFFNFK